jgi:hypothetical protein
LTLKLTGAGIELGGHAASENIARLGGGLDVEEAHVGGEVISSFKGRHDCYSVLFRSILD